MIKHEKTYSLGHTTLLNNLRVRQFFRCIHVDKLSSAFVNFTFLNAAQSASHFESILPAFISLFVSIHLMSLDLVR